MSSPSPSTSLSQPDDAGSETLGGLGEDVQVPQEVGEDSPAEVKRLLLLERVRTMLAEDLAKQSLPPCFVGPLRCDFPLLVSRRPGFHGFADVRVEEWTETEFEDCQGRCRCGTKFSVRSVAVQLKDGAGNMLPVEMSLATFIHELAHTITAPEMRPIESIPSSVLRLQPAKLRSGGKDGLTPVHHSPSFYLNFAELLRSAERLGIYALPPSPGKFSQRSLMRFDYLDPSASIQGLNLGSSALFGSTQQCSGRLRVIITDAGRTKQKPVTLEERSVAGLLKEAKQRLNLRSKPRSLMDSSGNRLGDEDLLAIADDSIIVVS